MRSILCCLLLAACALDANEAAEPEVGIRALVESTGLIRSAIGVTRRGTSIACLLCPEDLDYATGKTRVLLIGGAAGDRETEAGVLSVMAWLHDDSQRAVDLRQRFAVSAIPCLNPDGQAAGTGPANGSGGDPTRGYPPSGDAYHSKTDPEGAYVWRWIGMHAPDLVVEVRPGKERRWQVVAGASEPLASLARRLGGTAQELDDDSLVAQLPRVAPANVGTVPAMRLTTTQSDVREAIHEMLAAVQPTGFHGPSPARRELQRRLDRTPREIVEELLEHYGQELKQAVYIEAVAVMERLRHVQATSASPAADVEALEKIVEEYYRGTKVPALDNGSALSGHLVFCAFADAVSAERRGRYVELARVAADLGFEADGSPKPVMPFHSEMSDAVFMGGPILARVGQLTGEPRYFEACTQHLRFMRALLLREDGIYRHSPLDEAAWGRGNGFPALGLALCLSHFPTDHLARPELLRAFQDHLAALAKHQDPTGCWHQVVDRPESYREFTATCMITFAMARGVGQGWLDGKRFEPAIERGWYAIKTRIGTAGTLVDVCTGTGKQPGLRDYYDRTAILGRDPRGGAMALLVANEIDLARRETLVGSDLR